VSQLVDLASPQKLLTTLIDKFHRSQASSKFSTLLHRASQDSAVTRMSSIYDRLPRTDGFISGSGSASAKRSIGFVGSGWVLSLRCP